MLATEMTFDKIVEKSKCLLGKNYKGDKEMVPVYSLPIAIEGHTDAVLTVSNAGFSDEEIKLIEEKTKNYAWWVANHGYLIDNTRKEIPALFIYGSEIGNATPDVLNFTGSVNNGFYNFVNRTDLLGNVNNSATRWFIQFVANNEVKTIETDDAGNVIVSDGVEYEMYMGRLYPEDRIIVNKNISYPIHLVSNLDYYNIPIIGEPGTNLEGSHTMEYVEKNNLEILKNICEMVIHEAAQWTNRPANTNLMNDCWPVIVKCSCIAYLNRGAEGLNSQSELGQQNVYVDWVATMHQQITNRRYIL